MRRLLLVLLILALATPALATVSAGRATVADIATVIVANTSGSPVWLAVVNQCAATSVYVGGSSVATSTGLELAAGTSLSIRLGPAEALYGVVVTSTCRVDWIKSGG